MDDTVWRKNKRKITIFRLAFPCNCRISGILAKKGQKCLQILCKCPLTCRVLHIIKASVKIKTPTQIKMVSVPISGKRMRFLKKMSQFDLKILTKNLNCFLFHVIGFLKRLWTTGTLIPNPVRTIITPTTLRNSVMNFVKDFGRSVKIMG